VRFQVEIIVHYTHNGHLIAKLTQNLSQHNYEHLEFTLHLEDSSASLRLTSSDFPTMFDTAPGLEEYTQRICSILEKNSLQYTVIETMEYPSGMFGLMTN
jgi:hypothetical protein